MELRDFTRDGVTVRLTAEELFIISNALNEVCNALDLAEFATRMGVERSEVQHLLQGIVALHDKLALPSDTATQ